MAEIDFEALRQEMIEKQLHARGIQDSRVLVAMAKVPRQQFVAPENRNQAYADRAMAIDCGQTISQPYIVGLMTQALQLSGSETVLEIGTGSGYQTAILAELASRVISIERHRELSQRASKVLTALGYRNVTLEVADGTLGWPDRAPFDRIIVTAAAAAYPPTLFAQLDERGSLVIPLGRREHQTLQLIRKESGRAQTTDLSACRFVPLVGLLGWPE